MSKLTEQLTALIKPIVKKEIRNLSKLLAPLIKEEVEKSVNKILAEQFVRGMAGGQQNSLGGVFNETLKPSAAATVAPKEDAEKQKRLLRERYEERMGNLNVPKEDWALFEDLPPGGIGGGPGRGGSGGIGDDDGEGVDLSAFGL